MAADGAVPADDGTWTFDTPEPILAVVELHVGDVQIDASERYDTVVRVTPKNAAVAADVRAAENTRVEFSHGKLSVRGPKGALRSLLPTSPPSIDVHVELPTGSQVHTDLAHADLRTVGRLGASRLTTAHGDVSLDHMHGPTDVNVTHGGIRVHRIDGTSVIRNRGGGIDLGEVTSDVRISSAYGDISLDRALGDTVLVKSAYGRVHLGEVARGTVQVEAAHGRTELGIRNGTAAWLDVSSKHGSVRSELQAGGPPRTAEEHVRVRIRTGYGDIHVRRA